MQKRKYCLVAILSCALLCGCTSQVAKLPKYEKNFQNIPQSAVVVKLNNVDYVDLKRVQDANGIAVNDEYRILKPIHFMPYTYAQNLYNIQPGLYYISFIAIDSDKGVYYSEAPGVNQQGEIAYGAFNIKSGEILYIGDLECQWRSTNKVRTLQLLNHLAVVKTDLNAAGHADLATKIALAKFFPQGANLSGIK